MKITRLGPPQPTLSSGLGGNAGGRIPSGGNALQVLTSDGSNGRYWGENVARITANGSNAVLSPYVNFAGGSNTTLSVSSNTITIHGTGGGGASLTVADEGTPLATAATTLDFVGAGVTASGTGATKTITIPGGGDSDSRPYLDTGNTLDATYGDDFTASSLDPKWTPTDAFDADAVAYGVAGTWMQLACRTTVEASIYQTGPSKETFEVIASLSYHTVATATFVGIAIVSSTGTGVLCSLRADTGLLIVANAASYNYSSDGGSVSIGGSSQNAEYVRGRKIWLSLRMVPTALDGNLFFGRYSGDGFTWSKEARYDPATFTYAKLGWGRLNGGASGDLIAIDRFNVVDALDIGNNLVITPSSGTPTYTASSEFGGKPASAAANSTSGDWAANTGDTDNPFYWQVAWSVGQTLNRIVLKERAGGAFGLAHAELSDGVTTTKVPFRDFLGGASVWHVIDFATLTGITSLRIVSDGGGSANGGFIEVEAYYRS